MTICPYLLTTARTTTLLARNRFHKSHFWRRGSLTTVGLLTFSDGRDFVNKDLEAFCRQEETRLVSALESWGYTVVAGTGPITSNNMSVVEARRVSASNPQLTIFHYPVWAFPHFTMLATTATRGPICLFSNIDPQYPGMVGLLAGGGGLDQIGRRHSRVCGNINDDDIAKQLRRAVLAASAAESLRGSTFGRIGGRPMGMYTTASATDQWLATFGVDVEEIDQWEVVRRSDTVPQVKVTAARKWLEGHVGEIKYDGAALTPELLERQIRSYHAVRELIAEWHLDFCGIKGQPELTNHFATMDLTEAFLNDPYDWDGPKETFVCATESDMDGALTMQLLKLLSGYPVLFADVRHYHADRDVWDLCNSGQHATWYAERSDDPAVNLRSVKLLPEVFYFPAGGAAVHHIAAPGEATFARLSRINHRYRMQVVHGDLLRFDHRTNESLARQSTYEWPHAFARFDVAAEPFLSEFGANHIHAVPGDWRAELKAVCGILDISYTELRTNSG